MSVNSKIKVDSIEAYDPVGPVQISYGATVPSGGSFTINGNANFASGVVTATTHAGTNINATGIITASSLVGSATNLTSLPVISNAKSIAFTLIA